MLALEKARYAADVRKQYEAAERRSDRLRLARLLESISRKATPAGIAH